MPTHPIYKKGKLLLKMNCTLKQLYKKNASFSFFFIVGSKCVFNTFPSVSVWTKNSLYVLPLGKYKTNEKSFYYK